MQISFENGKIIAKTWFKTMELTGREIESIEVSGAGTTIRLRDQKKSLFAKGQYLHSYIYNDLGPFLVENHIAYKKPVDIENIYPPVKAQEMVEQTKITAQKILDEYVKQFLGENYAAHAEVVGDLSYSILVLRLVKNGTILYDHPCYDRIEEMGVEKALDALDLTWLESYDTYLCEGTYGVTVEVADNELLKDYFAEDFLTEMLEEIADYEKQ